MLVFVAGRNVPERLIHRASDELGRMTTTFPQLDPATRLLWKRDSQFVAALHLDRDVAEPRNYVSASAEAVTLFTGTAIDTTGRLQPFDAASLAEHWDQLPASLEGQFSVLRMTAAAGTLSILTDPLGIHQIYYAGLKDACLVSNNVGLLSRIVESFALDPLGAATFLTLGWTAFDRTLCSGVRVLPGGSVATWSNASDVPQLKRYFSLEDLAQLPRRRFSQRDAYPLAREFVNMLQRLAGDLGPLRCPLTAGRDARVLAAAVIRAGVPATYFTGGEPESDDVRAGKEIASKLGLTHEILDASTGNVVAAWDQLSHILIEQNDGMVNLWQAADVLQQPTRIDSVKMAIWGLGGEIGRSFYGDPYAFVRARTPERIIEFMLPRLVRSHHGLIRQEAAESVERLVRDYFNSCSQLGFLPLDLPDVFYLDERVRRWGGANARKSLPAASRFAPFCTRPYVVAAFNMPPTQRYVEPIHWHLLKLLAPELLCVAPPRRPWRSQRYRINMMRFTARIILHRLGLGSLADPPPRTQTGAPATTTLNQGEWLEQRLDKVRELCLDTASPELWQIVDRSILEDLLNAATAAEARARHRVALYSIETICRYLATGEVHATKA